MAHLPGHCSAAKRCEGIVIASRNKPATRLLELDPDKAEKCQSFELSRQHLGMCWAISTTPLDDEAPAIFSDEKILPSDPINHDKKPKEKNRLPESCTFIFLMTECQRIPPSVRVRIEPEEADGATFPDFWHRQLGAMKLAVLLGCDAP